MSSQPIHSASSRKGRMLPADFVPGPFDVLCARGIEAQKQNSKFRATIQMHTPLYISATGTARKHMIIEKVINVFRLRSLNGGFIRRDPSTMMYFNVGDMQAQEMVSRSFIEAVRNQGRKFHPNLVRCFIESYEEESTDDGEDEIDPASPSAFPQFKSSCTATFFDPKNFQMTLTNRDLIEDSGDDDFRAASLNDFEIRGKRVYDQEVPFGTIRSKSIMVTFN